ncbi:hypothetical protein GRI39_08455 [Altererythrobacter indicus]|uniref:Uncharacterized protein n=1 Tax=Altericroceibacterium indicum TaxID=374177 RepID=A0A845ABZ0_9SPHN|nr:hypothetical protein [Altericroceibacterium indicum]MXP26066.1 hypothetical protein [Altericroceibacterium indicum]
MTGLPDRLLRKLRERLFPVLTRNVLNTPPVKPVDDGVIIFSMIGSRVLLPYLVAVKSFHAALGRGRMVILDDGSLTAKDRAVLATHLGNPRIIAIADVDTGDCPRGGTWERLLTLLDLRTDAYVIQLDSDTVTLGNVPEIRDAIGQGRSFTIRGEAEAELVPILRNDGARARPFVVEPGTHVQRAIENGLGHLTIAGLDAPRYVRGCSGFAGFAPSDEGRQLAVTFSREAASLLGMGKWSEWGSEQVTSNFVIANQPDPLLLPYDKYLNFWNSGIPDDARFLHFIGTHRYSGNSYIKAARQAIRDLMRSDR